MTGTLVFHRRGEELAKAAEALQASAHDVEQFMNDLRQTLKPPWTAEHRNAFAAAIGRLRTQSRLRVLRTESTANGKAGSPPPAADGSEIVRRRG